MKVTILDVRGNWRQVADAARTTIKMDLGVGEPSDKWKKSITRAEHSPIRLIEFLIKTEDVKSWITVHNVRHRIGIEHFVSTQRNDRTGKNRDETPQGSLVDYEFCVNLNELMNICRKRFCGQAHEETRKFWQEIVAKLLIDEKSREIILPVIDLMVPECVARNGSCPEMKCCGYNSTLECNDQVNEYWD
ncbi:MAG: thymidylate synthase ThyX [Patescibacteria group bacterium]|jgi:hypothetical protein